MVKIIHATILLLTILTSSYAKISETLHNLAGIQGMQDDSQTCFYCHAPSTPSTNKTPLWNKTLSQTKFSMYADTEPGTNSYSMVCLSCHDGASSKNSVVNIQGMSQNTRTTSISIRSTSSLSIGSYGDIEDDHPVGITYIEGKAGLKPISEMLLGTWKGATTVSDLLRNGKVECESCHDPHFTEPKGVFLRNENYKSQLCFSCHDL